ncbi:hypothetical protein B840_09995 [Corynebacterium marinum DSM 44953]|uniref:Uncharacterized protein n=1 Tax=Corynebacterium marinum DSM 44953 TaxID=1224162 RepID=A0A0B6TXY5_9CORY|nr:hypothetical protein B840_09995 [Corynebacterium marinum DSM 44953]
MGIGEQADGDLRFESAFLGKAWFAEVITFVGFEIQGGDIKKNQDSGADTGMRGAGPGERIPKATGRVGR